MVLRSILIVLFFFVGLFFLTTEKSYAACSIDNTTATCADNTECCADSTNGICMHYAGFSNPKTCGPKPANANPAPQTKQPDQQTPARRCTVTIVGADCGIPDDCCVPETNGRCDPLGGGGQTGRKVCGAPTKNCTVKNTTDPCSPNGATGVCCIPETNGICSDGRCGAAPSKECHIKNNTDICGGDTDCCKPETNGLCEKDAIGTRRCGANPTAGPSVPPLPPVAPPPCATGKLKDGVCTAFMTAFGEINTDASSLILKIFAMLLAISGGLAVLLIMRAGYILMTSAGNGEQVKKGREQLVAAIVGLLFIIFSFVILEVIGVQILRLPEFEGFEVAPLGTCDVGGNQCSSGYTCNYVGSQGQCVKDTTP